MTADIDIDTQDPGHSYMHSMCDGSPSGKPLSSGMPECPSTQRTKTATPASRSQRATTGPAIRVLLSHKANPDLGAVAGYTPLMAAGFQGDDKIARMLLAAGADPKLVTLGKKQTAADLAEMAGHKELANLLRHFKRNDLER